MKKRFIILLSFLLIILLQLILYVGLSGCSVEKEETINSETSQITEGRYSLFRTQDAQEYLSFLENFDETNYEIVDISTSLAERIYGSDEFYIITYKAKSK